MLLLFILLLDKTEMAQNNSVFVFVWKTSNGSLRKPNLRVDMNQVTNLKSMTHWSPFNTKLRKNTTLQNNNNNTKLRK